MTVERNRGRTEKRTVSVYGNILGISPGWSQLKSIIKVERRIGRKERGKRKTQHEISYYISSLPPVTEAKIFGGIIRSHWSIENSLHYTKDVTFREDSSAIRKKQAPQNISLLRNMAINILRQEGYESIVQGIRLLSHQIGTLSGLLC